MPSETASESDTGALDFSKRAELSEWMDQPCSYEEFRACLADLAQVNRLLLAYRPTRKWLERLLGAHKAGRPLHVVDVGCGQGDALRYIARWAARRGVSVRLTGVDLNPYAARAAAEVTLPDTPIEWITGDAFSLGSSQRTGEQLDVVISSLFTHHLTDGEIVRFLAWMEREAKLGWFVNDLHRGAAPYYLFRLLARLARWHPFVQHDGPISVRRSFSVADWGRLCAAAGLPLNRVAIETFRPARLCVGRIK